MSGRRHSVIIIAIIVVVGLIGACLRYILFLRARTDNEAGQAMVRLLCETDHQALLEGCRQLSREVLNGTFKGPLTVDSPEMPQVIRTLRPQSVGVARNGVVRIEMYNKWWPLGVWAFPEGVPKPPLGYGDRKLLDGLWYYDDGYNGDPNAYDRYIDGILKKCGKLKE